MTSALHVADPESGSRSPVETVTELVRRVTALRNGDSSQMEALASLYSSDAHVSHPFHPFERDKPLLGRSALREHFARAACAEPANSELADLVVHQTTDPELVVAEFRDDVVAGSQRIFSTTPALVAFASGVERWSGP